MENIGLILSRLEDIIIPLAICVVLPVIIVWLNMRKKMHETNKRTEIVLAAIEKNSEIDVDDFFKKMNLSQMNPPQTTLKEKLMQRFQWGAVLVALGVALLGFVLIQSFYGGATTKLLTVLSLCGAVFSFVGIAFLLTYRISKKMMEQELEVESKDEAQ